MAGAGKKNPFLSGFLLGLFAGLALAVVVALLVTRSNPFTSVPAPGARSAEPAGQPAEAPKYEFYQTLPGGTPGALPAAPAYFLQAGAYGNAADAEQTKARLALLGFEAKILSVQEGDGVLHKVRIGPYTGLDELNSARARLTQNNVETILIKIAPPQQEKQ